jgi:hypothetical protein
MGGFAGKNILLVEKRVEVVEVTGRHSVTSVKMSTDREGSATSAGGGGRSNGAEYQGTSVFHADSQTR